MLRSAAAVMQKRQIGVLREGEKSKWKLGPLCKADSGHLHVSVFRDPLRDGVKKFEEYLYSGDWCKLLCKYTAHLLRRVAPLSLPPEQSQVPTGSRFEEPLRHDTRLTVTIGDVVRLQEKSIIAWTDGPTWSQK